MINVRDQIGILTEEYIRYVKLEQYENVINFFDDACIIYVNGKNYMKDQLEEVFARCKKQLGGILLWNCKIREVSDTSGYVYANLEETCEGSFAFTMFWSKSGYRWFVTHMHVSWKENE